MRNSSLIILLGALTSGCIIASEREVVVIDERQETVDVVDDDATDPTSDVTDVLDDDCDLGPYVAPEPQGPDADGDGLEDDAEFAFGTRPDQPDTDLDGLPDGIEFAAGTDPLVQDTDADGLLDGAEVAACTDPLVADTDADGVLDGREVLDGTDPRNPDTDGDGVLDGIELEEGTNPLSGDSDEDGLLDGEEVEFGTDPTNPDTDGDGLNDGDERAEGTNPFEPDSDLDGLLDGEEIELGTSPLLEDTDGDDLKDYTEVTLGTDPLNADTDGDGIGDGAEVSRGTDPLGEDTDLDGMTDGEELEEGTDPLEPDTDGDGVEDGEEIDRGSDPLDPSISTGDAEPNVEWSYEYRETCGCSSSSSTALGGLLPLALAGLFLRRRRSGSQGGGRGNFGKSAVLAVLGTTLFSGCYTATYVADGTFSTPQITNAYAACGLDNDGAPVWAFAVDVRDADGLDDIIAVEATMYDQLRDPTERIASVDLDEVEPGFWYVERRDDTLDCFYEGYTVDFFAYDHVARSEGVSVWAQTAF